MKTTVAAMKAGTNVFGVCFSSDLHGGIGSAPHMVQAKETPQDKRPPNLSPFNPLQRGNVLMSLMLHTRAVPKLLRGWHAKPRF